MKKLLLLSVCAVFLGFGCAPTTPANPTPTTQAVVKTLGENDNNSTVTANVGDRIHVVLNSTYWQFAPIDTNLLLQVAEPAYAPVLQGHVPGSGAGTVTVDYVVLKAGDARISASRTSCGEALRCTGDQGSYSVTISAK